MVIVVNGFTHVRGNTYYLSGKTNIGLVKEGAEVILIDSGNDKEAGRKLRQLLDANDLRIKYILNTHSNADHIGANAYLMNQYNCLSYGLGKEVVFSNYPELESSLLYGGFPTKKMKNKFLMAKPCQMKDLNTLETSIEYFEIPGHFLDMVAYTTLDNVCFLGDAIFPQDIIEKYHLFYIYDVRAYLNTLEKLAELNQQDDTIFIPSHGIISTDISEIINLNNTKVNEVIKLILERCQNKIGFDDLFKDILDYFNLTIDLNQYLLVGSTIRNYLAYLVDENKLEFIFETNKLYYKTI